MDILSEVAPIFKKQQKIKIVKKLTIRLFFAAAFGISLGNIFFGDSSLDTLTSLEAKNYNLKEEIKKLGTENAMLQKEYFELKNVQGF